MAATGRRLPSLSMVSMAHLGPAASSSPTLASTIPPQPCPPRRPPRCHLPWRFCRPDWVWWHLPRPLRLRQLLLLASRLRTLRRLLPNLWRRPRTPILLWWRPRIPIQLHLPRQRLPLSPPIELSRPRGGREGRERFNDDRGADGRVSIGEREAGREGRARWRRSGVSEGGERLVPLGRRRPVKVLFVDKDAGRQVTTWRRPSPRDDRHPRRAPCAPVFTPRRHGGRGRPDAPSRCCRRALAENSDSRPGAHLTVVHSRR